MKNACKDAGVPYGRNVEKGITYHDLRHTYNTNMRKAGVPESVIMSITGHSTREMFDRYDTVDLEDAHIASMRMQEFLKERKALSSDSKETDVRLAASQMAKFLSSYKDKVDGEGKI